MGGSNAFFQRYNNLFKSPERYAAEQAEKRRKHEEWLAKNQKKIEKEERKKAELRIVDNDERLRPYQQNAVKEILSAWHDVKSVMLQMPTGTGKTRLFVALINALNTTEAKNYKVRGVPRFLIITHREELVAQISETLNEHYNLSHVILGKGTRIQQINTDDYLTSNYANETNLIYVSSIQYLARQLKNSEERGVRSEELTRFDFIIVDEAHHSLADSYKLLWEAYPKAYKLGVTATPYRMNGEGFGQLYDKLIMSQTITEYIEQGYLADYRLYTVSSQLASLQKVNRLTRMNAGGDYQIKDLQEIYANTEEIKFLYRCYRMYANGKRGIIYAVNQFHAEMIASYFAEQGMSIANIDSRTASARRKELIAQFRNGELQVLVNVELFGEGFDCPAIEFTMLARPTRSLAMYLQQVGRALRPLRLVSNDECGVRSEASPQPSPEERESHAAQKAMVMILDCVGLYNRFGLPEENHDWEYFFEGDTGKGKRLPHLGIDGYHGGMIGICTPREETAEKERHERLERIFETFRDQNCLWGIRNLVGTIVVRPCCKELTKTQEGWFYGKDEEKCLRIYDKGGNLVFKKERCEVELSDNGSFFINAKSVDVDTVRIGPFDKNMQMWEKYLYPQEIKINERTLVFNNREVTVYVVRGSGIVMTSYRLTLQTQMFLRKSTYLKSSVLIGFDNKIYQFTKTGLLTPIRVSDADRYKILNC